MLKFISNSKLPGNHGLITSCNGKIFATSYKTRKLILCSNVNNTYIAEFNIRNGVMPFFPPTTVSDQTNKFPGTTNDPVRESQVLYTTQAMRISGLISYGTVVATSQIEPLILYYTYLNAKFELSLYNWQERTTILLIQQDLNGDSNLSACNFAVGAFASKVQQDVLVSCTTLGINKFYLATNYYRPSALWLSNWCSGALKIGDFNGDNLSDILCVSTKIAMINKIGSFVSLNLINETPGNWNAQITNNNFAVGDFDGDGLADLVSISSNYSPQILFRTSLNGFNSRSDSQEGAFSFNSLTTWCSNSSPTIKLLSHDVDSDGKDDILCQDGDNVYLAISKTNSTAVTPDTLQTVKIELDGFDIGPNVKYSIIRNNAPIICDASKLFEPKTYISCALNSQNRVESFTLPVSSSINLENLQISANIEDNLVLDSNYGNINLNLDHIPGEKKKKFPKGKLWQLDNINYNDPTRNIKTQSEILYIKQDQAKNVNNNQANQKYGYRTPGGDCYQIEFNHIVLTNNFTATGIMQAFDSEGPIRDRDKLSNIAKLYVNADINNIGDGKVTFSFAGQIELTTLYQKNVTYCTDKKQATSQQSLTLQEAPFPNAICSLQSYESYQRSGEVVIERGDTLELRGCIYYGASFYPNMTDITTWSNYSQSIDDITATMNLGDIELKAKVLKFDDEPKSELRIQFSKNNQVIHEPSGTNTLYAAFSDIKLVKLAAFSPTRAILAWSIFVSEQQQYYILLDYVNTANNLLRIASFDQYFNLLIPSKRYGSEFFIAYKTANDKLAISKYNAADFSPSTGIIINVAPETSLQYQIQEKDENIQVVITHGNNKGIFVHTYDVFLNQLDSANIICQTAKVDSVPTENNAAYQPLQLDYQHNSKVVYASLSEKIALQNALNYIYNGVRQLRSINQDSSVKAQLNQAISGLLCQSTLTYDYLGSMAARLKSYLQSNVTFEVASTLTKQCKQNSPLYYPITRVNQTVYLCPGWKETSTQDICNNLLDLARSVSGLIQSGIVAKVETITPSLATYSNTIISSFVQIVNGEEISSAEKSTVCDVGGVTTSDESIALNIIAGVFSNNQGQQLQQSAINCKIMAARSCSSQGDKESNTVCLSNFFQAASLAYLVTQSSNANINPILSCQTGCDLGDITLEGLLGGLGGYLTNSFDVNILFPFANYEARVQSNTNSNAENNINSNVDNVTTISIPNALINTVENVITSVPLYLVQYNVSMIALATLGNNYIALTYQYFVADNTPLAPEIEIGRFMNIGMLQIASFNESAIIFAYSVKRPDATNYNILVEYLSPTISKVLNIVSCYRGEFAIDVVPVTDKSTQFMVSYAANQNMLSTVRYKVTNSGIIQQRTVMTRVTDLSTIESLSISVNAFQAKGQVANQVGTFNVIWSYFNGHGIYLQRYNSNDGSDIGSLVNIQSQPSILRVEADLTSKTIIAWQTTNSIAIQLVSQDLVESSSYKSLSFNSGNYSLIQTSVLDGTKNIVSLDLIDNNNSTKTLITDASSNKFTNISFVTNNNNQATVTTATLDSIDNSNANAFPKEEVTGKVDDNIRINEPQCSANNVQKPFDQFKNLLLARPKLISQIQSLLSNTKLKDSLIKLGVSQETLYTISSANSLLDIITAFQMQNPLNEVDISEVPNFDFSNQVSQLNENDLTQSFSNFEMPSLSSASLDPLNMFIELCELRTSLTQQIASKIPLLSDAINIITAVSDQLCSQGVINIIRELVDFMKVFESLPQDDEAIVTFFTTTVKHKTEIFMDTLIPLAFDEGQTLVGIIQGFADDIKELIHQMGF